MTVLAGFSYSLVAYAIPTALFFLTVARQPHEVIVMILGAFFWLLSLLIAAIIWIIVVPLRSTPAFTLPISVILQELCRWLYFRLVKKADKLLEVVSDDTSQLRHHKIAYVGGLGFGLIAGIVSYANVVEVATGPGVVGVRGSEDSQYFVLSSAFGAQVIILLNICWGVLWFDGWEKRNWIWIVLVPVSHMFISGLSLLNDSYSPVYFLTAAYTLLIVLATLSLFTAGARPNTLKYVFTF